MTSNNSIYNKSFAIREFTTTKQVNFFESLKQNRYTGQLLLTSKTNEKWTFYLYLGRLIYAMGGVHPVRRWWRNVSVYLPEIAAQKSTLQLNLASITPDNLQLSWEYNLLHLWLEQGLVTKEQSAKMTRSVLTEVLFDVTQAIEVTCELKPNNQLTAHLVLLDAEQILAGVQKIWQEWQERKIADRSPNSAPIIRQPEELQQRTSPQTYVSLAKLLDGKQTLRDISTGLKRDPMVLTTSLLPYIQMGLVELITIGDLPSPVVISEQNQTSQATREQSTGPLIAVLDDSPLMCQTLEKILVANNYQFIGINAPLRAMAILMSRKPDLILLDLVMPNINGYEICQQLRRLTLFRHTPVVILTGNDGIVDRVRAKMVGATDFLSKPVNAEALLETIQKYLKQESLR